MVISVLKGKTAKWSSYHVYTELITSHRSKHYEPLHCTYALYTLAGSANYSQWSNRKAANGMTGK